MQWEGKEEGGGVQDRRGMKPAVAVGGGIGTLVVLALVYFVGMDPNQAKQIGNMIGGAGGQQQQQGEAKPINDRMKKFADTIYAMNNKVWNEEFRKMGESYEKPGMVLFAESVNTRCGNAPSAVGPFYCPGDSTVYLDPTFFDELEQKLGGSKAEFSQAYVIAHEVGHHAPHVAEGRAGQVGHHVSAVAAAAAATENRRQRLRRDRRRGVLQVVDRVLASRRRRATLRQGIQHLLERVERFGVVRGNH